MSCDAQFRILIYIIGSILAVPNLIAEQRDPSFFPSHGCFNENYQNYESESGNILRQANGQAIDDPYLKTIWESTLNSEATYNAVYVQQAKMAVQAIQSLGLAHGSYIRQSGQKPEENQASLDSENYNPDEQTKDTRKREIYFPKGIDLYSNEKGQENFKKLAESLCQSTNGSNPLFPASMCSQALLDRTSFINSFVQKSVAPVSLEVANNSKPSDIGNASLQKKNEIEQALQSESLGDNQFRHGLQTIATSIEPFIARQCGNRPYALNGYVYNAKGRPVGFFVRVGQGGSRPVAMFQPLVGSQFMSSYHYLIRADDSERQAFHKRAEQAYGLPSGTLDCEL